MDTRSLEALCPLATGAGCLGKPQARGSSSLGTQGPVLTSTEAKILKGLGVGKGCGYRGRYVVSGGPAQNFLGMPAGDVSQRPGGKDMANVTGPAGGTAGTESRTAVGSFVLTDCLTRGYLKPPRVDASLRLMSLARERGRMGLRPFFHRVKHFNKTSVTSQVLTNHR